MKRLTAGIFLLAGILVFPSLSHGTPKEGNYRTGDFSYRTLLDPITVPVFPSDAKPSSRTLADSLLAYATGLLGSPYVYGDTGTNGFDCSGFTTHVFAQFGVSISRSSSGQATDGISIPTAQARKGDLIIFTGTNPSVRQPGHVGIILTDPGESLVFVHASSVGGVKVSEVETTRYKDRFLDIRRVLER